MSQGIKSGPGNVNPGSARWIIAGPDILRYFKLWRTWKHILSHRHDIQILLEQAYMKTPPLNLTDPGALESVQQTLDQIQTITRRMDHLNATASKVWALRSELERKLGAVHKINNLPKP